MSNTARIAIDENAVIRKKLPKLWAEYTERCTNLPVRTSAGRFSVYGITAGDLIIKASL